MCLALPAALRRPRRARGVTGVDVRCDNFSQRTLIENPSTSVDAQSRALHETMDASTPLASARAASGPAKTTPRQPPHPFTVSASIFHTGQVHGHSPVPVRVTRDVSLMDIVPRCTLSCLMSGLMSEFGRYVVSVNTPAPLQLLGGHSRGAEGLIEHRLGHVHPP